jgi:hypothetical protein
MQNELSKRLHQLQPKIHGLAFGMTLGIGSTYLSQGCITSGACPACGACVARLPLLAVPLLLDGAVLLAGKIITKKQSTSQE